MTLTARQQLFKVDLSKRLKLQNKTNTRWLEIVETAKKAYTEKTAYLLSKIPQMPTYYRVTKKITKINYSSESKLDPHCVTNSKQTDISKYILRWDPLNVSDHKEYYRVMALIQEASHGDEDPLRGGKSQSNKSKEQQKVTDFYKQIIDDLQEKVIDSPRDLGTQESSTASEYERRISYHSTKPRSQV